MVQSTIIFTEYVMLKEEYSNMTLANVRMPYINTEKRSASFIIIHKRLIISSVPRLNSKLTRIRNNSFI